MSDETFSLGETVRLKSNGPLMTVKSVEQEDIFCEWFDEKHKVEGRYFKTWQLRKDDGIPHFV
jgi:uncharacterized protein YodC (DUF2158 family)